ncbi:MAG: putative DCC family thiol-disulfide oxidoreductase YuxK [Sulfitobacter sp.]|jgi:predicted DCC family thiol-disulfide oxidoreductase YuxK
MTDHTRVLYNGACPVCRREIGHYETASQQAARRISYDDLNDPVTLAEWGIDADRAARRLHLRKNGRTYAGIPAFIELWRAIPRYHWLARLISLPVIYPCAVLAYDHVLAALIYKWHLRRQSRA